MIRWIAEHLGTAAHDDPAARAAGHCVVDVRDLVDREGNLPSLAMAKINEALELLRAGKSVVVCCDYGMSRSNAIAIGVVAVLDKLPFREAVRRVTSIIGEPAVRVEVLGAVQAAVESASGRTLPAAKKRILVTGGSGFIGSALSRRWPGGDLIAPKRSELDLLSGAVNLDLWIKEQGAEVVVHLANPRIYTTNASMGETLVLLKNVIDACRQNRTRLVYLSSWEVYSGYRSTGLLAGDSLPAHPKGVYGFAKHFCEILLNDFRRESSADVTILRSATTYGGSGPKPRFIVNFLQKARAGEPIFAHQYENGFPVLDLLHIDDLVDALVRAIERPVNHSINVGAGRAVSTTDIAQLICELTGSRSEVQHRMVQGYAPNIIMDNSRALSLLGWQPRIGLRDGLRRLIESQANIRDQSKGAGA